MNIKLRPHVQARLKELFPLPLEPVEKLAHDVQHHGRVLEIVSKKKRPAQLPLAQALTDSLMQLLNSLTPGTSAQHRQLIHAAARYFAENQPYDDHDLSSDTGLDDDVEVFTAVASHVGRQDLVALVTAAFNDYHSKSD